MCLFGRKKEKPVVVPEPNKNEVDWFFTQEAKNLFQEYAYNKDEMYDVWFSEYGAMDMIGYIMAKGNAYRREYPCTFFADYLRVLKTIDSPDLAINAVDLALDGDGADAITYPDCLKPEFNPLINFALKIKPVYYAKNGEDLRFNSGMKMIIGYLHDAFVGGVDESNESWIYEKSLWFNAKGKPREYSEIEADIRAKAKYKQFINN